MLLKVAAHPSRHWTYAALGEALGMSALIRQREAGSRLRPAVAPARGEWTLIRPNLLEFVLHGARYVWPATMGPVKRGVPTSIGMEPPARFGWHRATHRYGLT